MKRHTRNTKGYSALGAGITMAIVSLLTVTAAPKVMSTMHPYLLGGAVQDVASLLKKARVDSVLENTPVVCQAHVEGGRTVIRVAKYRAGTLQVTGESLRLPPGMVVLPASGLVPPPSLLHRNSSTLESGSIAVFNPRGGIALGSGETSVLYLGYAKDTNGEVGVVSITDRGDTQAWRMVGPREWKAL